MFVWSIAVTPQIEFTADRLTVPAGGTTFLRCTVTAEPTANSSQIVRIMPNGQQMVVANQNNSDGERVFEVAFMFEKVRFQRDDGALFQCQATNDNGPAAGNLTITVQGELYIE